MKFGTDFEWQQISLEIKDYEFMFDNYDCCPWDVSGQHHLAMLIPVLPNRIPQVGENAIIGILDGKKNWEHEACNFPSAYRHERSLGDSGDRSFEFQKT